MTFPLTSVIERDAIQASVPMKKYNVGILGYGWVATAHIAAINATRQAQVTAVCSARRLDAADLSAKHGGKIDVYGDVDALLADKSLHAVSICSYPYDHAKQAMAAARAGKHLIIEKPLALSWKDCLAIQRAVKEARVKTCVCFECRYSSQFLAIKAVLDQGLLGQLHYGEVDYYHGIGPWYGQFRWNTRKFAAHGRLPCSGRVAPLPGSRCHRSDQLRHQIA